MEQKYKIGNLFTKAKIETEYVLIPIFILLSSIITISGYNNYRSYEKHYRSDVESQLSTISDLKISEISQYLKERIGNGEVLFRRNTFYEAVRRFFEAPEDKKNEKYLRDWLKRYGTHYQYSNAVIFDIHGNLRMGVPIPEEKLCPASLNRLSEILNSRRVELGDFCRSEYDNRVHLSVMVPVIGEGEDSAPIGVLVLRIDPEKYLYPFIKKWPIPSKTAETLLVRRDGSDVLFLNELRFQKDAALKLRFSIDKNPDLPAAKAIMGHVGIADGKDYRGVPVVAYTRPIPNSPWFLVARVDKSEIYSPLYRQLLLMVLFYISLIIVSAVTLWFVWRRQSLIFYKAQYLSAEALRSSEERYRRLFEAAQDGVLLIDFETGLITDVNPFLIEMLEHSKSDFLKKHLWEIGSFKKIMSSKDDFLELQSKEYVRFEDRPLETKSGKKVAVEFISNVYIAGTKKIIQCNIREITERKMAEAALIDATNTKTAFVGMVSHELRTPLSSIKEGVSVVLDRITGDINEEQVKCLTIVKNNVDRLDRLICEVLDFQKLESGKMEYKMEEGDINELVAGTHKAMMLLFAKKGLTFTLDLYNGLPAAKFDKDKITQVLVNLVNNAFQVTEKGGVVISTRRKDDFIEVMVKDTGEGIRKEDMPKLFQVFKQLQRKVGGSGLGLSISKMIIEAHNGKIWAESESGKGSAFYFTIPVKKRVA